MTQIAATVASLGGKGHHAGKSHGAGGGRGTDFAAVVAGLGQPAGKGEAADGDVLSLTGEGTGRGSDAASDEGKEALPVIVDLALGAAAQSAMADMVVAAQAPETSSFSTPELSGKTGKSAEVIAFDGRAAGRPAWHLAAEMPPADAEPSLKEGAAVDATGIPFGTVADGARPQGAAGIASSIILPDNDQATSASLRQAAPETASQLIAADADAGTLSSLSVAHTGVQTGTAFRQAVREAAQPAATTPVTEDGSASIALAQSAPIFSAVPQAIRDFRHRPRPAEAESAPPATDGTAASAGQAGTGDEAVAAPILQAVAVATDSLAARLSRRAEARQGSARRGQAADGQQAVSTTTATAAAGAPVMSALHRSATSSVERHAAALQDAAVADVARTGSERAPQQDLAQDNRQDDNPSAAAAQGTDRQAASASDASASSGRPFSDIFQNLPPIAQSRMSLVTEASAISTGPSDLGATLQGQAIDMGVEGQWIDRMAQEITALAAGTGHSRFHLSPPNLGRIQIDVWQGENGGQVQLLTETEEAAHRLREGKSGLEADARLAALSLGSITIERAGTGFDGGRDQSPHQQGGQRQQHPSSSEQGGGQMGTQTGPGQGDGRHGQASAQAGSNPGSQGQQNSSGQGKSPLNRDVLNERAGTVAQDGSSVRRDGDRLVRYA
ncbi:MAG: flagellar hook-length control protein FliK [Sphingobium sp.]